MRSGNRVILVAALAALPLAGCGMVDGHTEGGRPPLGAAASAGGAALAADDAHPLIGEPYSIDGQTFTPADVARYDEIGYAATLWASADGRRTANGETYRPDAIAAAHRTLPLPSYVEVTSIDTGKTIVVRVNDRGPMLRDRIIALTPAAARQLGIATDGGAGVRVRLVSPLEQERATLRNGGQVPERLEIPPGLRTAMARRLPPAPAPLTGPVRTASAIENAVPHTPPLPEVAMAPVPAASSVGTVDIPPAAAPAPALPQLVSAPVDEPEALPALVPPAPDAPPPEERVVPVQHANRAPAEPPPPAAAPQAGSGRFVVQVAALSTRARADALAQRVGGFVMPAGALFRVRTGPYPTEAAARAALRQIHAKGYADARMMTNDAR